MYSNLELGYERMSFRAKEVNLQRRERIGDVARANGVANIETLLHLNPSIARAAQASGTRNIANHRVTGTVHVPTCSTATLPPSNLALPAAGLAVTCALITVMAKALETVSAFLYKVFTKSDLRLTQSEQAAAANEEKGPTNQQTLRLIGELLLPDLALIGLCLVVLAVSALGFLAVPMTIGMVFDVLEEVVATGQRAALAGKFARTVGLLALALTGGSVAGTLQVYLSTLLGERFSTRLKKRLLEDVLHREQSFFDATAKGELLARVTSDVTVLQNILVDVLGNRGVRSMIEVGGSIIVIAVLNFKLAVVSVLTVPVLSLLTRLVVIKSTQLAKEQQREAAGALALVNERLSNVRTVRVFSQERAEIEGYRGRLQSVLSIGDKAGVLQGLSEAAGRFCINVGTCMLLLVGGYLVLAGQLSVGALLSFNVYNLYITVGIGTLSAAFGDIGRAWGTAKRVLQMLRTGSPRAGEETFADTTLQGTPLPLQPLQGVPSGFPSRSQGAGLEVQLRNVTFTYASRDKPALRNVSLTIPAGSTVAFVGASGSGKSTIGALLTRLYEPDAGSIEIGGCDIRAVDVGALRERVTLVQQETSLFAGTILENLRLARPDASMAEVEAVARAANAHDFICQLPLGYETTVGERGVSLSGGQKQRIAIARALLRRPRVLIADEATSALDTESEQLVTQNLRTACAGATQIIIAHRLSTVRNCDRICVFRKGALVEQGSHEELMGLAQGFYRRLVMTSESSVADEVVTMGESMMGPGEPSKFKEASATAGAPSPLMFLTRPGPGPRAGAS